MILMMYQKFQSTLPRRERRFDTGLEYQATKISIHAPAKGATMLRSAAGYCRRKFQSTLPRRERRGTCWGALSPECISIHAPAKGATNVSADYLLDLDISIHAPAKGATITHTKTSIKHQIFQSTLPRRERRMIVNMFL